MSKSKPGRGMWGRYGRYPRARPRGRLRTLGRGAKAQWPCPSGTELSSPLMRLWSPRSRGRPAAARSRWATAPLRWPARCSASAGTPIRSCSVLAAAASSFSALKLVGNGVRKPRPSSDFSRRPAQPAHLSPCAALLKPLGCLSVGHFAARASCCRKVRCSW